jgi:hypothetical protein
MPDDNRFPIPVKLVSEKGEIDLPLGELMLIYKDQSAKVSSVVLSGRRYFAATAQYLKGDTTIDTETPMLRLKADIEALAATWNIS